MIRPIGGAIREFSVNSQKFGKRVYNGDILDNYKGKNVLVVKY